MGGKDIKNEKVKNVRPAVSAGRRDYGPVSGTVMKRWEWDKLPVLNKWGYRVPITNPAVLPYYEQYLREHGIPRQYPLSDRERLEFEYWYIEMMNREEENQVGGGQDAGGENSKSPGKPPAD